MNKVALGLIIAAAVGCSASTFAATNGEGQINFTGEIIDSACQVVNGLSNPLNVQRGDEERGFGQVFTAGINPGLHQIIRRIWI